MRVWITGTGLATSLGIGSKPTFDALLRAERGLSAIDLFDTTGQRATLGAQVRGVAVPPGPAWSRASAFAAVAAREALAQAGIDPGRARVGLVVGGTTAGMFENEVDVAEMLATKQPLTRHESLWSHPLSSTGDVLDELLGPFVRIRNVASACSSGASALVLAMAWLLEEGFDAVVAGGTDALCRLTLSGFNALGAIDPEPCRPFGRGRRGLNLGEGAGFLVVERADAARARGKTPLAELAGGALAAEAHHITNPDTEGTVAARVMREAMERAGIGPDRLDYVNAHGTGTPLNDAMESKALEAVLGSACERVWVSSSKAQLGHTLAAAGAIEAVIATLTITQRALPPTVGLVEIDPACASLRHVLRTLYGTPVRAVLSNSFGFGGMDSALVITEPELGPERFVTRKHVVVSAARRDISEAEFGALDANKARRFDRSARLCAAATHAVIAMVPSVDHARCGVIFGSAFGAVDESAGFVARIFEKGPRLASPFDFPNLVPSSPVGHASIHEGLQGANVATADLRASGESALMTALELLGSGDATAFVAGAIAVRSRLIDQVFHPLFDDGASDAPRREAASAVLLEATKTNAGLVHVTDAGYVRESEALPLPPPAPNAIVFGGSSERALRALLPDSWSNVPVRSMEPLVGASEAAGAAAFAEAANAVMAGAPMVAVVGSRTGWKTYFVLARRA